MPIRVGVPLARSNSIKRQNGNLLQGWVVTFGQLNGRKIFVQSNNTIGTIFNELDFTQGSTGGSSDQIRILISGSYVGYFFRSDAQKWRLTNNRSGPDQENVVIDNKNIVAFTKVTSGSKTITLKGTARVGVYQ
jgi:hypothetical protein